MTSANSQRGSRARRWCTRLLVSAGGALATTAAAWALSTAGADAAEETGGSQGLAPRMDGIAELARDANDHVRSGAETAADALRPHHHPGPAAPDHDDDSGEAIEDRDLEPRAGDVDSEDFTDRMAAFFERLTGSEYKPPAPGESPDWDDLRERLEEWFDPGRAEEVIPGLPIDDLPGWDAPGTQPDAPILPAPRLIVPAADSAGAMDAVIDVTDRGTSPRGAPAGAQAAHFDLPGTDFGVRMPASAPAVPAVPGAGTAGASAADGSPLAVTVGSDHASAATAVGDAISGALTAPRSPGRQPGVTPD